MRDLISGEEAKLAWANNELVLYSLGSSGWNILNNTDFYSSIFNNKQYSFKLKPKTITLNGIEIPAPFVPKSDQEYWILFESYHSGDGYKLVMEDDQYHNLCFGAWRTEDQIKQVVAALRNVFGGNK